MFGEEPGKQKTGSCRTQELARSSAQGNEWRKRPRTRLTPNRGRIRTVEGKLKRRMTEVGCSRKPQLSERWSQMDGRHGGGWSAVVRSKNATDNERLAQVYTLNR